MRILVAGGTGQLGQIITRGLIAAGHQVQVLGRSVPDPALRWDGRTQGAWARQVDGADAVVNLAGRSVNCRYNWTNLNEMMASRVESTLAIGEAIAASKTPPRVWLQASTASIYPHTLHEDNGDDADVIGTPGDDVPAYWGYSTHIARAWELALSQADTPHTRKVAMRLGFTMSPDPGGVFDWLAWVTRMRWGGPFYGGEQYMAWLHDIDLVRAVRYLLQTPLGGTVNVTAPEPVPNRVFMAALRDAMDIGIGLPVVPGIAEVAAYALKTDVEILRKSRRVVPTRLTASGFTFRFPTWEQAVRDLVPRLDPQSRAAA